MSIEPNAALLEDTDIPRIRIAGREWPVPPLAIRQNAKVQPLLVSVMPVLERLPVEGLSSMTEQVMTDLATIAYWCLDRGHNEPPPKAPALTRAAFDEWVVTLPELIGAAGVAARQTGLYRTFKRGEKPAGEASAALPIGVA